MKKILHVLGHVGLGAIQVATVGGNFVPPPWNLAVSGGAAVAQVVLGWFGVKQKV